VDASEVTADILVLHRISPDGRFLAIGGWSSTSPSYFGKVSIAPSQGASEPQLVAENARLIDWTRDGRDLIVASKSSGSEALYLLPVKAGRADGDPIFVRCGPCMPGSVNSDGALVYYSALPSGTTATWIGNLDSAGHIAEWKTLKLGADPAAGSMAVRWSPDSSQIVYTMREATTRNYLLRVRNMATGEDRELYRGKDSTVCSWASQHASLFCGHRTPQDTLQVFSIAPDSGRVEQLGSIAGYPSSTGINVYFARDDDRAIYLPRGAALTRWEIGAEQATAVDQMPGIGFPESACLSRTSTGLPAAIGRRCV
jgi:Tol biopolymer transport system component